MKRFVHAVRFRLRALFDRRALEAELDLEVRDHIERETAAGTSRGLAPAEARRAAIVRFGGVQQYKEEIRDTRGVSFVETLLRELRFSGRMLGKSRLFTAATVLTLALGIGGAAAVFAVVNGVLLRPLPFVRADRLAVVSHTLALSSLMRVGQSDATFLLYRRDNRVFSGIGAYRESSVNLGTGAAASRADDAPRRIEAALATPSLLGVLGVEPIVGRGLRESDAMPGAPPVVAISEDLWRVTFGSSQAIIGRNVNVDGVQRQVVGVMPAAFHFPAPQTQLWLPLVFDPARTKSAEFDYVGIARLRDGVTIDAAAADVQRLLVQVPVVFPGRLTSGAIAATKMRAVVQPLRDVVVGDVSRALWLVFGAVGTLLLIACANVANLFLARAEGRQREFAVRRALGADRALLLQASFAEALIVSIVGGGLGFALAKAGVLLLQRGPLSAGIPRLGEVRLDAATVAFTILVTFAVALAVSVLPAVRSSRVSLGSLLASGGRTATGAMSTHLPRRMLVVSQVALGLILVSGAVVFARSFARLSSVDPGFDPGQAITFRVALPAPSYPTTTDVTRTLVKMAQALRAIPGVGNVGATTRLPLDGESHADSAVFVEDHPRQPGTIPDVYHMVFATPGYFTAMKIPLVVGRPFDEPDPSRDAATAPREVIVNEAFARRYWTVPSAVGKRIRMNPQDAWSTIVGVVGATHDDGLEHAPPAIVYSQLVSVAASGSPWAPREVDFVLRNASGAADVAARAREALRRAAPEVPLYHVITLRSLMSGAVARTSFTALLLGIAAVIALGIGAAGIFGVIASFVALRRKEIGVRLALGAQPAGVRRLVVLRAVSDAAVGVAIGLAGAIALGRAASSLLFTVSASDPLSLTAAAAALMLTAVAASWLPARQAAMTDPMESLRAE